MKGIESIIAIILVLMIVIALAALAYTWFSGIFASLTSTAGTAVTSTTNAMATQFRIEAAKYFNAGSCTSSCINVTIRNTGTQIFNASLASAYVNATYSTINWAASNPGNLAPGATATFNITNATTACPLGANQPGVPVSITIGTGISDIRALTC
jgi:flagellin-like protein